MTYIVRDREFEAVLALAGPERYAHFVKRVADDERVWSLRSRDGWVLSGDAGGPELVPVWPHERFAAACARDEWAGAVPAVIPLDEWLERWIPGMTRDGRQVAVFPAPSGQGVVVAPQRLADDLAEELTNYE